MKKSEGLKYGKKKKTSSKGKLNFLERDEKKKQTTNSIKKEEDSEIFYSDCSEQDRSRAEIQIQNNEPSSIAYQVKHQAIKYQKQQLGPIRSQTKQKPQAYCQQSDTPPDEQQQSSEEYDEEAEAPSKYRKAVKLEDHRNNAEKIEQIRFYDQSGESKKRKKKKRRKIILDVRLGQLDHIDSTDPFLKSLFNTVLESQILAEKLRSMTLKAEGGEDNKSMHRLEGRRAPNIQDFISYCSTHPLKGVKISPKDIIKHFKLPTSGDEQQRYKLLEEVVQAFTTQRSASITNEQRLRQQLYEAKLYKHIMVLDEEYAADGDNIMEDYTRQATQQIQELKQYLKSGAIGWDDDSRPLKIQNQHAEIERPFRSSTFVNARDPKNSVYGVKFEPGTNKQRPVNQEKSVPKLEEEAQESSNQSQIRIKYPQM